MPILRGDLIQQWKDVYYALCQTCRAKGPAADEQEEMVALTNHRPIEDALQKRVKELEARLKEDKGRLKSVFG